MSRIEYDGLTFDYENIVSGEIYEATSLLCDALEVGTIQVEFYITDEAIGRQLMEFRRNAPLTYYEGDRKRGIWYVESVGRTGKFTYEIKGNNAVGLLVQSQHMGSIYTGQTVAEVVAEICTVPYVIKRSLAGIKLYGWLPVASRRDNLAQVLFAIGAVARVDQDGVLHIEGLWDGTVFHISEDRVFWGDKVKYESLVTEVSVLEHQYFEGTEEADLFDGSTQAGDVIVFNEPMHSLTATGITILESGANYAVVSAGSGTITGKRYNHATRAVKRTVSESDVANVIEVKTPTLVSIVNSDAIAERLAEFYRCVQTMENSVVYEGERAGEVASFQHPYGGDAYGTIKSVEITLGNQKAVATEKTLIGYRPVQGSNLEYLDFREVLTGSGEWEPPEGVDFVRYAMFSGARGGKAGLAGEAGSESTTRTYSYYSSITGALKYSGEIAMWGGPGGKGGEGGEGGDGSKLLEGSMDLTPGVKIPFSCGVGGKGATFNAEAVEDGEEGAATTFGDLTTDDGTYPAESGWVDVITGEVFATPGPAGLPGGDGAGAPDDYTIPSGSSDLNEILKYKPATGAVDEDGVEWPGGPTKEKDGQENVAYWETYKTSVDGTVGSYAGFTLGPGGAVGVTLEESTVKGKNPVTSATAADGLQGATPAYAPRKAALTKGGRGGYGGGGGSCASWAGVEWTPDYDGTARVYAGTPGPGGLGSDGGEGGDGCILLYYRVPKAAVAGAIMDSKRRFFLDRTGRLVIV